MTRFARYALEALSPGGHNGRLTVLIFHRVHQVPDPLFPEDPDAGMFAEMLERLHRWFNIVSLPEALDRLKRRALPARALAITFDDGYADNFTVALPILERLRTPATFFVAAGFLDGGRMFNDAVIEAVRRFDGDVLELTRLGLGVHDTATRPARRRTIESLIGRVKYLEPEEREEKVLGIARAARAVLPDDLMLSSAQLRMLRRAGMGVGGHTLKHPILGRLKASAARAEILLGKERLEGLLGEPINLFAYPNGKPGSDFGPEHVQMVRKLGFMAAFSTAPGAARAGDDLHQLPRFMPWQRRPWRQLSQFLGNFTRRDFSGASAFQLAQQRTDRPVDIHELSFVAIEHDRSPGPRRPTAPRTRHAPEARLVLEHEPYWASAQFNLIQDGSQRLRKFFFHASCATRSLLGWRVSGAILRHPCRANSRHTTEAATGRPRRCANAARIGESTSTPASLACSAQGAKNCVSCSMLSSALRRPPQRGRFARGRTDWRKRSCSRGTVARPTPKMAAVCSNVAEAKAGSRTAWAARSCSRSVVWATACRAFTTSPLSIRRGLVIQTTIHLNI